MSYNQHTDLNLEVKKTRSRGVHHNEANVRVSDNKLDLFPYDKKQRDIVLTEVAMTCQDKDYQSGEKEKGDSVTNELGLTKKYRVKIMLYVKTQDKV